MINQRLKNVRRASFRVWELQENYKTLEDRKNCECYVSKEIQETNFKMKVFPSFFSLFFFCLLFSIRTFDYH